VCIGGTCSNATSCLTIFQQNPATPDGIYTIDSDGGGGNPPYDVFCDMSNDGGGWTLVANVDDVSDPFFTGFNTVAWESTTLRNTTTIPTFSQNVAVSTKYLSWITLPATDLRIVYKNDGKFMLCEGLSVVDTLDKLFSTVPPNGQCAATCGKLTQDRLTPAATIQPIGLNCNDGNQGWASQAPVAENARIGGLDADNQCCVMNAFLGAMGDRAYSTNILEKTWGEYSTGVVADDNIMVFVR